MAFCTCVDLQPVRYVFELGSHKGKSLLSRHGLTDGVNDTEGVCG